MKKKGQEEIVGFILIVVLISVIALIFLAISIRKPTNIQDSKEIENFLQASLIHTTDCQANNETIYNLKELIIACNKRESCINSEEACFELNKTISEMISSAFQIEKESKTKGYNLYLQSNNITLNSWKSGIKTGEINGGETFIYSSGDKLILRLELYS